MQETCHAGGSPPGWYCYNMSDKCQHIMCITCTYPWPAGWLSDASSIVAWLGFSSSPDGGGGGGDMASGLGGRGGGGAPSGGNTISASLGGYGGGGSSHNSSSNASDICRNRCTQVIVVPASHSTSNSRNIVLTQPHSTPLHTPVV